MPLNILIADDHRLFGELLKGLLLTLDPAAEVDSVPSLPRAFAEIERGRRYDLVLLDFNMPGMLGLTGLAQMIAKLPATPVALVSGMMRQSDVRGALKAGARGILPKTLSGEEFCVAIRTILEGGVFVPAAFADDTLLDGGDGGGLEALTARERQAFEALVGGRSNAEIALVLGISEVTVKIHLQHVYRKIGAKNRSDAVRIGMIEAARRHAAA